MFSYIQAHQDENPKNTQAPRMLDCLYMRPLTNHGGHELLHLATGRLLSRPKVDIVPMTDSVINTVNALAASDGITGLKMLTKTGQVLYDSAWIAGVDYEEQQQQEDEDDEQEQENLNDDQDDDDDNENDDPNEAMEILAEEPNPNPIQAEPQQEHQHEDEDEDSYVLANEQEHSEEESSDDDQAEEELQQPLR